jgi:NAD(P)-dependent dehydrogenase (short-subunit alcohol dehydrogenase family)
MKLKDKVAIITGASKGIGKAIAERYAKEDARVMLASRSVAVLEEIAKQINDSGGEASAMGVDVCDHQSIEALVRHTVSVYGCQVSGVSKYRILNTDWVTTEGQHR